MANAIRFYEQSDFVKAKKLFLHLIETRIGSPEIEDAQWYLVLISEKSDKPNIIRQKIRLFVKSYPGSSHKKAAEGKLVLLDQKLPSSSVTSGAASSVQAHPSPKDQSDELAKAIQLFQQEEYNQAKSLFYRLIQSGNGTSSVEEAYWYLALISEKTEKPALALESFKRFLKSFPASLHKKDAEEKSQLLAKSGTATGDLKGKEGAEKKETPAKRVPVRTGPDRISGSLITEYLYDYALAGVPEGMSSNTQSRLSEFLDFRWRKGSGPDLRFNFSGMNANDFLVNRNDRTRLNKLYLEGNNVGWFSNFRLGRQPSSGSTLFNRFDGLSFGLPVSSVTWTNSVGAPVDIFATDTLAIESERKFYESYLSVVDYYHITGKIYFTQEYFQEFSTRRAVGLNAFWMYENFNLTTLLDRDIDFNKINDAMVNFDYTRSIFHYSGLVEYRRNPFLDFNTALADPANFLATPPITTMDDLIATKSREEIMASALAATQTTLDYSLGLSIDLSLIWRVDFRYGKTFYNPTDLASHMITFPMVDSEKIADRYSAFILERNYFNQNEIISTLFLYSPGTDSTNTSIVANMLRIWPSGFQGGLRFRYENTVFNLSAGSSLTRYVPGFVMRYSLKNGVEASLEGDYLMEDNSFSSGWNNTIQTRTSVSIPF
ncbi:MAG: tetratricopeptide repeat protein [Nitrospirae bacterium]|nr:tetratricopeptide repeat protein [Nitrospirota bacterium]